MNISNYIIEDFEIKRVGYGWYISHIINKEGDSVYMHKNGTLHSLCGGENFFRSAENAEKVLNKAFNVKNLTNDVLPNELFEI